MQRVAIAPRQGTGDRFEHVLADLAGVAEARDRRAARADDPTTAGSTACTSSGSTPGCACMSAQACAARSSAIDGARRQPRFEFGAWRV